MAAIRASGDPISLADIKMDEVPPEQNAATYLRRAKSDAEALAKELDPIWKSLHERTTDIEDEKVEVFPNEDELLTIEAAFAAYPNVIPLLQQATNCPGYFVDYSEKLSQNHVTDHEGHMELLMNDVQETRMFARIFTDNRFYLLMEKEQYDEVIRDHIALLKLNRLLEKEPSLMNFLVRCALRCIAIDRLNQVLQSKPVSHAVRQELEEELAKTNIRHDYLETLKTERAFCFEYLEESCGSMSWYARVFWNWQIIGACDLGTWAIDRATAMLPENDPNGLALQTDEKPKFCGMYYQLLLPALQATEAAANRTETQIRLARVLNALGRREDPNKMPAADLSDLGLPETATIDPFSGKPFIVKKVDGGWLVYSVGENRIDDGGKLGGKEQLDIGLQPVSRIQVPVADLPEEE